MADYFTANGVKITEGLRVWDNNLDRVIVSIPTPYGDEGWFDTLTEDGRRGGMSNGERMTTVNPFTGERA
ncbi:MAG: hypothetical protein M3Q75_01055 [Gemmatimonadota bacterium]|nr:hypothetical protein [Gemmatimonadota bacterium]